MDRPLRQYALTVNAHTLTVDETVIKEVRAEIEKFLFDRGFKSVAVIPCQLNPKTGYTTRLNS